ncbi:ER-golgi trafficking TRAPP I complex 85 kDa subunit-domain-containing protein [Corynascus novoguineensis]|uniref:ER-golgi trafficking TRAPP I complex 85 kDa subunit-domain-containing protein n=1 Tax=Corynascus novoguineensis TaxID=1126955 RepID=A0AAN7CRB8_9PEZI|nr:ER-golgi trafficking TRAPP I complex 85 kDa subunit-domain-containing protein [Corynascus novoguineensis]
MTSSSSRLPKTRQSLPPNTRHPLSQTSPSSETPLPARQLPLHNTNNRRSTPASAASLFRSTLTPPGSRSASPAGSLARSSSAARSPARMSSSTLMTGSVFGGGISASKNQSLLDAVDSDGGGGGGVGPTDPLNLLLRSFVPHIAIHTSEDVDELVRDKGFRGASRGGGGLWELLRPFGERVQGRVMIRDSNGAAKAWEDFAVRFVRFGEGVEELEGAGAAGGGSGSSSGPNGKDAGGAGKDGRRRREELIAEVETVVERHLRFAEGAYAGSAGMSSPPLTPTREAADVEATSPYYALYLRRLLSGMPLACHESFAHPVACVMAISSRNPAPIEALQKLYRETSTGQRSPPPWVDGEYLRYYVLVHDEENGDIAKSMALFEQMKRNFGLHCHLLRLRSSQSAETDDDSIPLPRSDWMTAAEELADIEESETREDFEDPTRYIFESDATAIRTFVREMVTQSVLPTMERNVSIWNDQVASRRRGLSGRFMSLSKRFTFGSSSRSSSGGGSSSSSNYDALGFYRADSPEAIMRRLADFAFMLRDWKLAMSTYDLLRSDFQNDKAWMYHASANEMAALALLIMPQNMSSKTRLETINQMLEQAFYSYHLRCNSLYGAVRCTVLGLELLRLRGGSGIDEAVQWGTRVLESRLMGTVGDALLKERMAVCYASKKGAGSQAWGSRRRKSALWSVLSAKAWVAQAKYVQAHKCLNDARRMYALLPGECGVQSFGVASDFLAHLNDQVKAGLRPDVARGDDGYGEDGLDETEVDEESETLGNKRSRRTSLIGPPGGGAGLETAPLHDTKPATMQGRKEDAAPDDGFG